MLRVGGHHTMLNVLAWHLGTALEANAAHLRQCNALREHPLKVPGLGSHAQSLGLPQRLLALKATFENFIPRL